MHLLKPVIGRGQQTVGFRHADSNQYRPNRKKTRVSVQHSAIKGLHVRIQILTCYESFVPTHDQPFVECYKLEFMQCT